MTSDQRRRFVRYFGVPEFIEPWLDRFFEVQDIRLVLALCDAGSLPPADPDGTVRGPKMCWQSRDGLCGAGTEEGEGLSREELGERYGEPATSWDRFLGREYRRGIIDFSPDGRIRPADFHARFEVWAIFEGWKDVPDPVRRRLNEWERAYYRERKRPQIEARREGREEGEVLENEQYLLLPEAESLIDEVEHVYLWPCNCRAMEGRCDLPVNVCLRFENDRDLGWEISKERAKEVLREANRAGLMHTGEVVVDRGRLTGAICNCCADCCFPHLVAEELGAQKLWPRSRYVAVRDDDACTACGRCVRRCHFGAFTREKGEEGGTVRFDPEVCRGCGVCVSGCPEEAITMSPLEEIGRE